MTWVGVSPAGAVVVVALTVVVGALTVVAVGFVVTGEGDVVPVAGRTVVTVVITGTAGSLPGVDVGDAGSERVEAPGDVLSLTPGCWRWSSPATFGTVHPSGDCRSGGHVVVDVVGGAVVGGTVVVTRVVVVITGGPRVVGVVVGGFSTGVVGLPGGRTTNVSPNGLPQSARTVAPQMMS